MAILGDRYLGTYEGHTIELIRNNLSKTLKLLIDGREVARAGCILPSRITLRGTIEHEGTLRTVIARSIPRWFLWSLDTIEVDGKGLSLTKVKLSKVSS